MLPSTKQLPRVRVNMADIGYAEPPALLETLLGSCVGIALRDRSTGFSGLAHIVLPYLHSGGGSLGRFADTAIPEMLRVFQSRGIAPARIEAKIAGGSQMFPTGQTRDVGRKNIEAVHTLLREYGLRLLASHVGGRQGRVIVFEPISGALEVYIGRSLEAVI